MCGRYTLKTLPAEWGQLLLPMVEASPLPVQWVARYNIAPTQKVFAAAASDTDPAELKLLRWGLVPGWAPDLNVGNRMINARSETASEKRSFSGPLKKRRCLIPADGYYEWKKTDDGKQPFWITKTDQSVMLFAGLWERNRRATGELVESATILTTSANEKLAEVHDRMPVILDEALASQWLDMRVQGEAVEAMMGTAESDLFAFAPVSKLVNNPRNDLPECLAPPSE